MTTSHNTLSRAVIEYSGYGARSFPQEDEGRLKLAFDGQVSDQLLDQVRQILVELGQLKPDWSAHTLESAGIWAVAEMARNHPDLDKPALDALAWIFTWWWR
ncbi:hypothetical protein [Dyella amyloliquefaciens]|uniref:hypothetical protein n=1 Tax=Dyella amyloliquefaciens TaxID=1770545 RepID=UPI00102E6D9F|nr:hypothetical protein [Dyella amyloliquefaciens]